MMRPPTEDGLYEALLRYGRDVEIGTHLTTGERNACMRAVRLGMGHLRPPGYKRRRFVFRLGRSPYGVIPPSKWTSDLGWAYTPDLPHYEAGLTEGRRLAADHYTYDSRFEQETRTRYTAADDCDEPGPARDAYWFGVHKGYFE